MNNMPNEHKEENQGEHNKDRFKLIVNRVEKDWDEQFIKVAPVVWTEIYEY
jgi:hypothetical protein